MIISAANNQSTIVIIAKYQSIATCIAKSQSTAKGIAIISKYCNKYYKISKVLQ